jgi:AraC-like DNA-binding protein
MASPRCSPFLGVSSLDFGPLPHRGGLFYVLGDRLLALPSAGSQASFCATRFHVAFSCACPLGCVETRRTKGRRDAQFIRMRRWRLIQVRRFARCRQALGDPAQMHRSVSEIAYGWGFSDMTHFGRRFKSAYGMLPRECRRRTHSS